MNMQKMKFLIVFPILFFVKVRVLSLNVCSKIYQLTLTVDTHKKFLWINILGIQWVKQTEMGFFGAGHLKKMNECALGISSVGCSILYFPHVLSQIPFSGPSCGTSALFIFFVTETLVPSMQPDTKRPSKNIYGTK